MDLKKTNKVIEELRNNLELVASNGWKGKFEFHIDGEKQIVKAGDGVYIPPNAVHGAVCLEDGILIDVFSPIREDFMDGSGVSYFGEKK